MNRAICLRYSLRTNFSLLAIEIGANTFSLPFLDKYLRLASIIDSEVFAAF